MGVTNPLPQSDGYASLPIKSPTSSPRTFVTKEPASPGSAKILRESEDFDLFRYQTAVGVPMNSSAHTIDGAGRVVRGSPLFGDPFTQRGSSKVANF